MPPLLLFVTDWIEPDKNASAARQLFLSWSNPFKLQKPTFLFKIFMAASTNHLICCARLSHPPLPYAPVDPEISSSSLPLVARRIYCFFFCLVRLGRSSCFVPLFLRHRALPSLQLLYYCPLFVRVCFSLSGLLFTCYRCICFLPIPLLLKPVFLPPRHTHTPSLAFSIRLRSISFFASHFICLNCVSDVAFLS